jgi:hypothetical protein
MTLQDISAVCRPRLGTFTIHQAQGIESKQAALECATLAIPEK